MVPDAATVARRRHLLRTILRCVALGLLLISAAPALVLVAVGLLSGLAPVEILFRLAGWAGYALAAAALLLFERRLVAWLVPLATSRCPQCDYFLVSLTEPRCPECGLPLSPEFLEIDRSVPRR